MKKIILLIVCLVASLAQAQSFFTVSYKPKEQPVDAFIHSMRSASAYFFFANATVGTTANGCGGVCTYYTGHDATPLKSAVAAMTSAGSTVTVYGDPTTHVADFSGDGVITMPAGGSTSAYNIVQVNPGDKITTAEWIVNGFNKIIGDPTNLMYVQDPSAPNSNACVQFNNNVGSAPSYVWLENMHFQSCGTIGPRVTSTSYAQADHVFMINDTITYLCSTPSAPNVCLGINAIGNGHWWLENLDVSHASDVATLHSSQIVVRNSFFHDMITTECEPGLPTGTNALTVTVDASGNVTWVSGQTDFRGLRAGPGMVLGLNGTNYVITAWTDNTHMRIASPPAAGTYGGSANPPTGGYGSNCHIDFGQTEPGVSVQQIMLEGNYGGNNQGGTDAFGGTSNGHGQLMQGDACPAAASNTVPNSGGTPDPCSQYIRRYNRFVHIASGSVLDENALRDTGSPGFRSVSNYNNDDIDFNFALNLGTANNAVNANHDHYSLNPATFGNLEYFYYYKAASGTLLFPYVYGSTVSGVASGTQYGGNMAFVTADGSTSNSNATLCNHNYVNSNCTLFNTEGSNLIGNPQLTNFNPTTVNYSNANWWNTIDLHPLSTSPLIGHDIAKATVVSGCAAPATTTSIVLNNSEMFFDGWGFTGISGITTQPDTIWIGAPATNVQISANNVGTSTLTLSSPIVCTNGAGVGLFAKSDGVQVVGVHAPVNDIGGVPFSPLATVALAGSGTGTVTSADAKINCGATCSANYFNQDVVVLTATPAGGSTFAGWSGGLCTGTSSCSVTMTQAASVTATFDTSTGDVITSFSAVGSILPNSTFTLSWNTTCTTASINQGVGSVSCGVGSTNLSIATPSTCKTYTLTTGDGHQASETVCSTGNFIAVPAVTH